MQNDFLSWKIKKELIPLIIATSIIFSILFLNFLPEFTGFPYWDHDFAYLSSFGMVNSHDARWFGDILGLLTGNDMIPSLALLWSHLFRALGTVCAVYFLCRSEQCFPLVLGALIIALSPENLPHYMYRFQTILYPVPLVLISFGLLVVESRGLLYFIVGCLCMLCAFGTHPAAANSALVLVGGRMLFSMLNNEFWNNLHDIIRYLGICIFGMFGQLCITKILTMLGVATIYNTRTISLSELFGNIKLIILQSFQNMDVTLNQAYMPNFSKLLILILIAFCLLCMLKKFAKESIVKALLELLLFFTLIPLSRIVLAISGAYTMHYRVGSFGTTVLTGFFLIFLFFLVKNYKIRLLTTGISILIIYIFFSQNFLFQRHMRDQFISDILYAQRVVDRIEQLDGLNETQTLSIVFIGTQPYNAKMYWKNYNYSQSIEELRRSSMAPWMPDQILRYVAPNLQLRNTPLDTIEDTELREKIRIHAKKHTWPDKESIARVGDIIICVLDNRSLQ